MSSPDALEISVDQTPPLHTVEDLQYAAILADLRMNNVANLVVEFGVEPMHEITDNARHGIHGGEGEGEFFDLCVEKLRAERAKQQADKNATTFRGLLGRFASRTPTDEQFIANRDVDMSEVNIQEFLTENPAYAERVQEGQLLTKRFEKLGAGTKKIAAALGFTAGSGSVVASVAGIQEALGDTAQETVFNLTTLGPAAATGAFVGGLLALQEFTQQRDGELSWLRRKVIMRNALSADGLHAFRRHEKIMIKLAEQRAALQ